MAGLENVDFQNISDIFDYNNEYEEVNVYSDTQSIVVYSVLLYIGLCTNIWMLWSLYKSRKAGDRAQCFLLAICITETIGLIIFCSKAIGTSVTMRWTAGAAGCKLFMVLQNFGINLSQFILVGFNVDNVVTLIRGSVSKVIRVVFHLLAVVCTLSLNLPNAFLYGTIEVSTPQSFVYCIMTGRSTGGLVFLAAFGLPIILVCIVGGISICVWCTKRESLSNSTEKEDETGTSNIGREIGLTISLNFVFIVCWTPYLLLVTLVYGPDFTLYHICKALAIASSCINPLVYAVFKCLPNRQNGTSPGL